MKNNTPDISKVKFGSLKGFMEFEEFLRRYKGKITPIFHSLEPKNYVYAIEDNAALLSLNEYIGRDAISLARLGQESELKNFYTAFCYFLYIENKCFVKKRIGIKNLVQNKKLLESLYGKFITYFVFESFNKGFEKSVYKDVPEEVKLVNYFFSVLNSYGFNRERTNIINVFSFSSWQFLEEIIAEYKEGFAGIDIGKDSKIKVLNFNNNSESLESFSRSKYSNTPLKYHFFLNKVVKYTQLSNLIQGIYTKFIFLQSTIKIYKDNLLTGGSIYNILKSIDKYVERNELDIKKRKENTAKGGSSKRSTERNHHKDLYLEIRKENPNMKTSEINQEIMLKNYKSFSNLSPTNMMRTFNKWGDDVEKNIAKIEKS